MFIMYYRSISKLEKCSVNSLFDIEGGLYAPAINHFLSLIYTSRHRVSIFSLSKNCFLLDGKSDLIKVSK